MKSTLPKICITRIESNGMGFDYAWCHRNIYDVRFNSEHHCKMMIGYIDSEPDYVKDEKDEGCYVYCLSAYAVDCEELSDDELEYLNEFVNDVMRIQKSKKCSEDDDPEFDKNEEEKLIDEIETDLCNLAKPCIDMYNKYDELFYDITSKEHFDMQVTLSGEYLPDILKIYGEKSYSKGDYEIVTDNYEAFFNDKYEMIYFYNYNTGEEYEREVA